MRREDRIGEKETEVILPVIQGNKWIADGAAGPAVLLKVKKRLYS